MACKKCGDPTIDSKYRCHSCDVTVGCFKWCVITKVPKGFGDDDGNWFDQTIDFNVILEALDIKTGATWKPFEGKEGFIHLRQHVFQVGEIIPVSDAFEREMVGPGRKPGKWDIEYQTFSGRDYKKALQLAIKVTKESYKDKTNLEFLEEKVIAKEQLIEKQQVLKTLEDPFKVIYGWIKQNHITLKESKALLGEVFKNDKEI